MGKSLSPERFGKIRSARQQVVKNLPPNVVATRLEKGQTNEIAFEQYPHGKNLTLENFKTSIQRAEIRKRVSELMFKEDQKLPPEEQAEIINRQINRYYDYEIGNPNIHGHIEAPHGIRPSDEVVEWCNNTEDGKPKIVAYEINTHDIACKGTNHMVFSRPRLFADVNSLPGEIGSSLRSEGAVYTREDNLNAVTAQRDTTKEILAASGNLDEHGKAKHPHLAIYFHGKVDVDQRGHDFEIAARQRNGKGPLDPRLAFWIAEKLQNKVQERGLKNVEGKEPTVNIVAYKGSYSGSPALTRMRYGDNLFDFKGFGEMLQCLQLECSKHLRQKYPKDIGDILNEIVTEFTDEFKTPQDFQNLDVYAGKFEEKIALEKSELFQSKNLGFDKTIAENSIALSKSLREELEVQSGDQVIINGQTFTVTMMKKNDLKSGKTMMLHSKYKGSIGEKISIEKADAFANRV